MYSISSQYPISKRICLDLQRKMEIMESGSAPPGLKSDIKHNLDQLATNIRTMNGLLSREGPRKRMWRTRLKQMNEEYTAIHRSFKKCLQMQKQEFNNDQNDIREQLFGNRINLNLPSSQIEAYARERSTLSRSGKMLDEVLTIGAGVMENLGEQRRTIQGANYKAKQVSNIASLSSSLLRMIGLKERTNAFLTYACMIFTILLVGTTFYYVRYLPAHSSTDTSQTLIQKSESIIGMHGMESNLNDLKGRINVDDSKKARHMFTDLAIVQEKKKIKEDKKEQSNAEESPIGERWTYEDLQRLRHSSNIERLRRSSNIDVETHHHYSSEEAAALVSAAATTTEIKPTDAAATAAAKSATAASRGF